VAIALSKGAAQRFLPLLLILIVMPVAALAIVAAFFLIWRGRLRRLTRARESGDIESPFRRTTMGDIVFILITVAFFALAAAYTRGCERL
jgi:hypothetical protein